MLSPFPSPPKGSPALPLVPAFPWFPELLPLPRIKFPIAAVPLPSPWAFAAVLFDFLVVEVLFVVDFVVFFRFFSTFSGFGAEIFALFPEIILSWTIGFGFTFGPETGSGISISVFVAKLPSWFAGSSVWFPFWLSPKLI